MKDDQVLAEKRKRTKRVVPGAVALQGGHINATEGLREALYREVQDEMGIVPIEIAYVRTLLHRAQEFWKLHYFAVTRWEGEMIPQGAEAVVWIPLNALETLDLDVDHRRAGIFACLHIAVMRGGACARSHRHGVRRFFPRSLAEGRRHHYGHDSA